MVKSRSGGKYQGFIYFCLFSIKCFTFLCGVVGSVLYSYKSKTKRRNWAFSKLNSYSTTQPTKLSGNVQNVGSSQTETPKPNCWPITCLCLLMRMMFWFGVSMSSPLPPATPHCTSFTDPIWRTWVRNRLLLLGSSPNLDSYFMPVIPILCAIL